MSDVSQRTRTLQRRDQVSQFLNRLPQLTGDSACRSLGGSGSSVRDTEEVLRHYYRQREIGKETYNRLLRVIPPGRMFSAAQCLGLTKGKTFTFHDESQMAVLQDFLYFTQRSGAETLMQQHARQSSLTWNDDERAFLQAASQGRFCLVLMEKLHPGLGFDFVDLLTGQQGLLIDINLSMTGSVGMVLATHVIPVHGTDHWSMTGASLPITDDSVCRAMFEAVKKLDEKFGSLLQLPPEEQVQFETLVLRNCLQHPTPVRYADAGEAASWTNAPRISNTDSVARVGRNEICPCGSGIKFKRCCGSNSAR